MPNHKINATAPTFRKDLKDAIKLHRKIATEDLHELFEELEKALVGNPIQDFGGTVFKARVGVKSDRISPSRGYRLLYYYDKDARTIYPLRMYAKKDFPTLPDKDVQDAIDKLREALSLPE